MAKFHCAIEMEPKTLNPGQINHAKELAVAIFQKMEPQEASDFFTQGLREEGLYEGTESNVEEKEVDTNIHMANNQRTNDGKNIADVSHQCLCNSLIIESPDEAGRREPLTAPF